MTTAAPDLRATADMALCRATQLAQQHKARLSILHVLDPSQSSEQHEKARQALDRARTRRPWVIASIAVPGVKFVALTLLLVTVQRNSDWARRERSKLYSFIELIGYWSMLDVIVVALVAALVKFQALGDIEPRAGILFFGMVVVFTMLSAMSFDPRLIWDTRQSEEVMDGIASH